MAVGLSLATSATTLAWYAALAMKAKINAPAMTPGPSGSSAHFVRVKATASAATVTARVRCRSAELHPSEQKTQAILIPS